MSIGAVIRDFAGKALRTVSIGGESYPVILTLAGIETQFKSVTHSDAGTITLTKPRTGGAIVLTDLLISAEKVAAGSCKVQFTDGTNTVVIFNAITVDAPANVGIAFSGRWVGWKDAKIDTVTTGTNIDATVSLGYLKLSGKEVQEFAEWDAKR